MRTASKNDLLVSIGVVDILSENQSVRFQRVRYIRRPTFRFDLSFPSRLHTFGIGFLERIPINLSIGKNSWPTPTGRRPICSFFIAAHCKKTRGCDEIYIAVHFLRKDCAGLARTDREPPTLRPLTHGRSAKGLGQCYPTVAGQDRPVTGRFFGMHRVTPFRFSFVKRFLIGRKLKKCV